MDETNTNANRADETKSENTKEEHTKSNSIFKNMSISWYVWLFPAFALMLCIWLLVNEARRNGPNIKIHFEEGTNISAEKTSVRFKGVDIGEVKDVYLSDDAKSVVVEVALKREAARFATKGSKFWIVMAKVTLREVTGLDTFIGGTYISALPGDAAGNETGDGYEIIEEFKGQSSDETVGAFENTTAYYLETAHAESVNSGDLVTFRGIEIGSVKKVTLSRTGQVVVIQIQVDYKYNYLIRTNTQFWQKAGVKADLGLFSSEIKINSFDTILNGGIELFTPEIAGPTAKAFARFRLLSSPPKGWEKWNPALN